MIVTVLGSGTSTGVPLIQCHCEVCTSDDPRNKRLRASIWIQVDGKSLLVDTSTDLRQQALRERIARVDAVLYTHPHADHIHGIDELRSFNFIQKSDIPIYGNHWTASELRGKFPYIFNPTTVEGGGIPQLTLHEFDASVERMNVMGVEIVPLPVAHGSKECVGYRIKDFAYVTDCSEIPQTTLERMQSLEVLMLDCLRIKPHTTHFNLDQALQIAGTLKAKRTVFTHLGHEFEYGTWKQKLSQKVKDQFPKKFLERVELAYDGLKLEVEI